MSAPQPKSHNAGAKVQNILDFKAKIDRNVRKKSQFPCIFVCFRLATNVWRMTNKLLYAKLLLDRRKSPKNLAYLALRIDFQNLTSKKLASNLAQSCSILAQSCFRGVSAACFVVPRLHTQAGNRTLLLELRRPRYDVVHFLCREVYWKGAVQFVVHLLCILWSSLSFLLCILSKNITFLLFLLLKTVKFLLFCNKQS